MIGAGVARGLWGRARVQIPRTVWPRTAQDSGHVIAADGSAWCGGRTAAGPGGLTKHRAVRRDDRETGLLRGES